MDEIVDHVVNRIIEEGGKLVSTGLTTNIAQKAVENVETGCEMDVGFKDKKFYVEFGEEAEEDEKWKAFKKIIRQISKDFSEIMGPVGHRIVERSLIDEIRETRAA